MNNNDTSPLWRQVNRHGAQLYDEGFELHVFRLSPWQFTWHAINLNTGERINGEHNETSLRDCRKTAWQKLVVEGRRAS
jgi:hypothetical protein